MSEEDSFKLDLSFPLMKNDIFPRIFTFCSIKEVMDLRLVCRDFSDISRKVPIKDKFYCKPTKPRKFLFSTFRFENVVIDCDASWKTFIKGLDQNHSIIEVRITPRVYGVHLKDIKKLCEKKTFRVLHISGVREDYRYVNHILKHSNIHSLSIKENILNNDPTSGELQKEDEHNLDLFFNGLKENRRLNRLELIDFAPLNDGRWSSSFHSSQSIQHLEIIKKRKNLSSLSSSFSYYFEPFFQGVCELSDLEVLVFEGYYELYEKDWLPGLNKVIERCHLLKYLSICRMGLTDEGFKDSFSKQVEKHGDRLKTLKLSWNELTTKSIHEICFFIRRKTSLTTLTCALRDNILNFEDKNNLDCWKQEIQLLIESIPHSNIEEMNIGGYIENNNELIELRKELEKAVKINKERIQKGWKQNF